MANLDSLSDVQAILLACELCAASNVAALPHLQQHFPTSLTAVRLFRILLSFLPESTPPQQYTTVLDEIDRGVALTPYSGDIDITKVKNIEESAAWKRVRRLKLLPLKYPHADTTTDPLTDFLIHRAHKIDAETGLQTYILELILPFYRRSESLRQWLVWKILPLLRSNYEYYPDKEDIISLAMLESMDQTTGINVLLSMTGNIASVTDLTRNLRGLVGPWICGAAESKRRRLSHDLETNNATESQDLTDEASWDNVNDWLLSRSLVEFDSVANALDNWDGPEDVDLGGYMDLDYATESEKLRRSYGQAGLAIIYATDPARGSLERLYQIATKIARLLQIDTGIINTALGEPSLSALELDLTAISAVSKASLLQNGLLREDNALTVPSSQSLGFLQMILISARILRDYGYVISSRSAASLCLHSNGEAQSWEVIASLDLIVKQPTPGQDWRKIREQLLWLRDWKGSNDRSDKANECHGLFWRVSRVKIEIEILKAMVTTGAEIYTESHSPLELTQVETAVVDTIISFYDTASNGNKTRGKMKKAVEILHAFQPRFSNSKRFKELAALIAATHALSFYSLTLQHGVPFQPVSIRAQEDPLSLIEKVLDQNPKSYTKLDDLLSIGRNFVTAGLVSNRDESTTQEQGSIILAERRIISMAVTSALASDDFGTAYSYILTRLTPPSLLPSSTSDAATTTSPVEEDISWRAAYNAGRYRSPTTSTESDLASQINNLSQRMELLSLALILAPSADPLPEVLGAWRRCDEEMTILRNREFQEAEAWDQRGDRQSTGGLATVPGGFGPTDRELDAYENAQRQQQRKSLPSYYDGATRDNGAEAPMGLFDVARGAARAFSKNLTPLQQQQQRQQRHHHQQQQLLPPTDEGEGEGGEGLSRSTESLERVRKRDVVSNMVTGGLASGIGWVLGAQPVNNR
uniref:Protein transport protein sec39 n=1 Tax=Talaromyces marneffei PM1 TaxID=1077442 RepID=A0A093VE21_TALMA